MPVQQVIAALAEHFPDVSWVPEPLCPGRASGSDQLYLSVLADRLIEVMAFLRDDERTRFEQLIDLTCVDYLQLPQARERFGVVYSLLSLTYEHRLWVKCFVNDPDPQVPSVTGIWKGANWLEREVYDMFGIRFTGHPDLRRILTWDGFQAHPLRKDYPLRGQGERVDYKVLTRASS